MNDDLDEIIRKKLDNPNYDDSEIDKETIEAVYAAIPGDYDAIDYEELLTGVKNGKN